MGRFLHTPLRFALPPMVLYLIGLGLETLERDVVLVGEA